MFVLLLRLIALCQRGQSALTSGMNQAVAPTHTAQTAIKPIAIAQPRTVVPIHAPGPEYLG
jgi:hypothetical protein